MTFNAQIEPPGRAKRARPFKSWCWPCADGRRKPPKGQTVATETQAASRGGIDHAAASSPKARHAALRPGDDRNIDLIDRNDAARAAGATDEPATPGERTREATDTPRAGRPNHTTRPPRAGNTHHAPPPGGRTRRGRGFRSAAMRGVETFRPWRQFTSRRSSVRRRAFIPPAAEEATTGDAGGGHVFRDSRRKTREHAARRRRGRTRGTRPTGKHQPAPAAGGTRPPRRAKERGGRAAALHATPVSGSDHSTGAHSRSQRGERRPPTSAPRAGARRTLTNHSDAAPPPSTDPAAMAGFIASITTNVLLRKHAFWGLCGNICSPLARLGGRPYYEIRR